MTIPRAGTLVRWAAYIAALPFFAAVSYATGDTMSWAVTGWYAVVLAVLMPLIVWSHFRGGAKS